MSTEIVHVPIVALVFSGDMFDVDHATVLCTDRTIAERLAELLERHGLADVPDYIPDAVTWAPPHPDDRLIDWRLPVLSGQVGVMSEVQDHLAASGRRDDRFAGDEPRSGRWCSGDRRPVADGAVLLRGRVHRPVPSP